MQLTVRGKNVEVTAALKDYVAKKVGKIERYFDLPVTAQVTLSVQRDRHIVEVTLPLDGGFLVRGEEATGDMYASIDLVVEKLARQLEKYKARLNRH
ncbi:MAG: ribosome-associated translation inhibitor RaiA, partial [Acetobacteraceae bacterium]|nr:ribosome-associated translation inhibitor RaiA [Acetobacteraceae bacterium]